MNEHFAVGFVCHGRGRAQGAVGILGEDFTPRPVEFLRLQVFALLVVEGVNGS